MATTIRKDDQAQRYELRVDEAIASYADFDDDGERVVMPHTVTQPAFRGQGLAAQVVQFALDDIRASGRRVVPSCWFVAQFIDEHPEYRDLLAD